MYRGGHDDYLIVRPPGASGEGDILLGGGRAYARGGEEGVLGNEEVNGKVSEHLSGATASYFRSVGDEDEEGEKAEWTGIMGFTRDGMPVVGALEVETEKGLWVAAGFNGHGEFFLFRKCQGGVRSPGRWRLMRTCRNGILLSVRGGFGHVSAGRGGGGGVAAGLFSGGEVWVWSGGRVRGRVRG